MMMRCDLAVCVLGEVTNSHTVYLESSFLCFFFYLFIRSKHEEHDEEM